MHISPLLRSLIQVVFFFSLRKTNSKISVSWIPAKIRSSLVPANDRQFLQAAGKIWQWLRCLWWHLHLIAPFLELSFVQNADCLLLQAFSLIEQLLPVPSPALGAALWPEVVNSTDRIPPSPSSLSVGPHDNDLLLPPLANTSSLLCARNADIY